MNENRSDQENNRQVTNQDSGLSAEKTPRLLNRRTLLKGLFFGAASAMLPKVSSEQATTQLPAQEVVTPQATEAPVAPETEKWKKRQFIIDSGPAYPEDKADFDNHAPINLVAEYPVDTTQWAQELVEHSGMKWDELPEDVKQTLLEAVGTPEKTQSTHGIDVAEAATITYEQTLGIEKSLYDMYPLQRTARLVNPNYQDSIGNKGIQLNYSTEEIINVARQRSETVVSVSTQLGIATYIHEQYVRAIPKEVLEANSVFPITVDNEQRYIIAPFRTNNYDLIENKPLPEHEKDGTIRIKSSSTVYLEKTVTNGQEKWINVETGEEVSVLGQEQVRLHFEKLYANSEHVVDKGKTDFERIVPYTGELALRNFKEALRTARECPDKLWIYSAGNESEEIGQLKAQVIADGEEIPENILFIAQLDKPAVDENGEIKSVEPTHFVWGADLYIYNQDYNVELDGSSFSAPIVSSIAQKLAEQGLNSVQIKHKLLEMADVYDAEGSKMIKANTGTEVSYIRVPTYKTEKIPMLDRQRVMLELNPQEFANQFGRG